MIGRAGSKGRLALALGLCAGLAAASGCTDQEPFTGHEPASLVVTVVDPTDLGDFNRSIDQRTLTFVVQAFHADGQLASDYSQILNVFAFSEGTLSALPANPDVNPDAVTFQVVLQNGQTDAIQLDLPTTFEATTLWVEDTGENLISGSFATGASPPIYYPTPRFSDINRPPDESSDHVNFESQLNGKTVYVDGVGPAADGYGLVVTGVFAQFFTATDVDPNEQAKGYNHLLPFSFSAPQYHRLLPNNDYVTRGLVRGQRLRYVQGGVTEFNGLTELSFPSYDVLDDDVDPNTGDPLPRLDLLPDPVVLDAKQFNNRPGDPNSVALEKLEGAIVQVNGGTVCPIPPPECQEECAPCNPQNVCFQDLPADIQARCSEVRGDGGPWVTEKQYCSDCNAFYTFNQWKLNFGDCDYNSVAVVTAGQSSFDPIAAAQNGQAMASVAGALTNVAGISDCTGNVFSFWVLKPRDDGDVLCPDGPCPGQASVTPAQ